MRNYSIFYYHNLNLSFKSAQTLQVIKDYLYLSKRGYKIHLFGEYESKDDLADILEYLSDSNIKLYTSDNKKISKIKNKIRFINKIIFEKSKKIIITRHYKKLSELFFFSKIFKNIILMHEMHEESFPYLFKKKLSKNNILNLFKKVNALIFTNYSQVELYKNEFSEEPNNYIVLPNGVEIERFKDIKMANNFVLTYLGQFNEWKNVDLIFESLSLLDDKFTLRIAGGKGDEQSKEYITKLMKKYNISENRVNYLGFVKNTEISKVLNDSNLLLLPLGDNVQSKYLTSPMKLFEYMATKVPVLSVDYPTVNLISSHKEINFAQNNADDFSHQIKEIISKKSESLKKVKNMNILVEEYSYVNRSKKFDEFIDKF